MVAALIKGSDIDCDEFIRSYRLATLYSIAQHYPSNQRHKILSALNIQMTKNDYKSLADHLVNKYKVIKDHKHRESTVKEWCIGLNGCLDMQEPLGNRYMAYPVYARMAVNIILNGQDGYKSKDIKYNEKRLLKLYGPNPFEDFEEFRKKGQLDIKSNEHIVNRAYLLMLKNGYTYYHDPDRHNPQADIYSLTDAQWDWLSRQLYDLKDRLDKDKYPVIHDHRFEGGQSLFWMHKGDYPQAATY